MHEPPTSAIVHARIGFQPTMIRETKHINQSIKTEPPAFAPTFVQTEMLTNKNTTQATVTGRKDAQADRSSGTHHSPDRWQ